MAECAGCGGQLTGRQRKWCGETCQQEGRRWDWVLKTYGLTKEQYEAIWEAQEGRCPITGRDLSDGEPHIDHDHVEGHVRGIVTAYANTRLIGRLRDWKTAQNLADYLRDPPAVRAVGVVVAPGRRPRRRRRRRK